MENPIANINLSEGRVVMGDFHDFEKIFIVFFCFFISLTGFALILIPRKKTKSYVRISFLCSLFFLFVGMYMSYTILFSKTVWQKREHNIFYAKCNAFQNATLILLDFKAVDLFLEYEDKFIEQYAAEGLNCVKQKTALRQEKFCKHILKDFDGNYDYGILIVFDGKISYVYIIDSGNIVEWCYKTYK